MTDEDINGFSDLSDSTETSDLGDEGCDDINVDSLDYDDSGLDLSNSITDDDIRDPNDALDSSSIDDLGCDDIDMSPDFGAGFSEVSDDAGSEGDDIAAGSIDSNDQSLDSLDSTVDFRDSTDVQDMSDAAGMECDDIDTISLESDDLRGGSIGLDGVEDTGESDVDATCFDDDSYVTGSGDMKRDCVEIENSDGLGENIDIFDAPNGSSSKYELYQDGADIKRYSLSPGAQAVEYADPELKADYLTTRSNELSELNRQRMELGQDVSDSERSRIEANIKQAEFDIERLNGGNSIAPNSDFVYKSMSDLAPPPEIPNVTRDPSIWEGDVGNSKMFFDDPEINDILNDYNQDGVVVSNYNPDFRPFTDHYDEKLGYFRGEVAIPDMKGGKDSFVNEINPRTLNEMSEPGKHQITESDLGNYKQADIELARRLNVSPQEVRQYRKDNGMTWHECRDGVTVQMVPTKLHDSVKHYGGVSLMKEANNDGRITRDYGNTWKRDGRTGRSGLMFDKK